MIPRTQHPMLPDANHDEAARQAFVNDFRVHLATEVFPGNFNVFHGRIAPAFEKENGRPFKDRHEVRKVMTHDPYYQMWSAMQRVSQEMVWDSAIDALERQLPELMDKAERMEGKSTLRLDPDLEIPRYHQASDIHLQPGAYHEDQMENDLSAGALYDVGTYLYAMGGMGPDNAGLGWLLINFFKENYPDIDPRRILDMGCTTGNSSVCWAMTYPEAEVQAIDVGAPVLRYAKARANGMGATVHFSQQNAEQTDFEDESFDLVVSHIMLHETSRKALPRIFAESRRLLRPGGLMLHMDLPQAHGAPPLEGFLFEWEIYNNNEHFYGALREIDLHQVAVDAGFASDQIEQREAAVLFDKESSAYSDDGFAFPVTVARKS